MMSQNNPLRVAYIGCGAVTERSHLPAIQHVDGLQATVLIDANVSQAKQLASTYKIEHYGASADDFINAFDCAVIATPSGFHAELAKQMLAANKHVLIEKPLAIDYQQAEPLLAQSKQSNMVLAVGLIRRLLPHYQLFKSLIEQKVIGDVTQFDAEEGCVFNWPVQSAHFYDPLKSGGGVLMDTGAHLLDACLWWFGDYESVNYADDSLGGVEADCELSLTMKSGATGVVRMSRLRNLSNQVTAYGERGSLSMDLMSGELSIELNNEPLCLTGKATESADRSSSNKVEFNTTLDLFIAQYYNFRNVINGIQNSQKSNLVTAEKAIKSVKLIDECYQQRSPLAHCEW